jgi:hypothetical protein
MLALLALNVALLVLETKNEIVVLARYMVSCGDNKNVMLALPAALTCAAASLTNK